MIRRILVFLALFFAAFFIRRWADQPAADKFLANLKNISENKGTKIAQISDTNTGDKMWSEGFKSIIIDTLSDKSDSTTGDAESDAYLQEKILEQENLENNKQTQTGSELNSATNKAPGSWSNEFESNQNQSSPSKPSYPSMINPAPKQPTMIRPAPTKPSQIQTITIQPTSPQVQPQPKPTPTQPSQTTTVKSTSSSSSSTQTSWLSSQDRTEAEQVFELFQ